MDGCNAMCSQIMSDCPIHQFMGNAPSCKVSHTWKDPFNHKPQSHDYPTCAESMHIHRNKKDHNFYSKTTDTVFDDGQHEQMMKDYYSHNQDKMTPAQIWKLKIQTFPYLDSEDVRLYMSDRNIIRKERDLDTDSVLEHSDKQSNRHFFSFYA